MDGAYTKHREAPRTRSGGGGGHKYAITEVASGKRRIRYSHLDRTTESILIVPTLLLPSAPDNATSTLN